MKTTDSPPLVSLLPLAFSACKVIVVLLPDWIALADSLNVDLATLTAAPVTAILGAVEVTGEPLIVAVIVLLPSVVPVKVAV